MPKYFSDQAGSFEIVNNTVGNKQGRVFSQMAPGLAYIDCPTSGALSIIGQYGFSDISVSATVYVPVPINESMVFAAVGARVAPESCTDYYQNGYFLVVFPIGYWEVVVGNKVLLSGQAPVWTTLSWNEIEIQAKGIFISAYINKILVGRVGNTARLSGFAAIGSSFNSVLFDNFKLASLTSPCETTIPVTAECRGLAAQKWEFNPDGSIGWFNNNTFCLDIQIDFQGNPTNVPIVSKCDPPNNPYQIWSYNNYTFQLYNNNTNKCLTTLDDSGMNCGSLGLIACNEGDFSHQLWFFDSKDNYFLHFTSSLCIDGGIILN